MADGFIKSLPDPAPLRRQSADSAVQINGLMEALNTLALGKQVSPLTPVNSLFGELSVTLDVDVSGLQSKLPIVLRTLQNALPPASQAYLESIQNAYAGVQDFLENNPLAKQIALGKTLHDLALAVLDDTLKAFDVQINTLSQHVIDPQLLQQVMDAYAAIANFQSDFPDHQDAFLPFITIHLVGVSLDLLHKPLDHIQGSFTILGVLDPQAVVQALGPQSQILTDALQSLTDAVNHLDPTDSKGYEQIRKYLNDLEQAMRGLGNPLLSFYKRLSDLIASQPWESIFSTYCTLLQEIPFEAILSDDDVIKAIASVMNEVLTQLNTVTDFSEIGSRIEALNQWIDEIIDNAVMGQAHQVLLDFLGQIRDLIDELPTDTIQADAIEMLQTVRKTIDDLQITHIRDDVKQAFDKVNMYVSGHFNDVLKDSVKTILTQLLDQGKIPSKDIDENLIKPLEQATSNLDPLLKDMQHQFEQRMADLNNLVVQLDQVSFAPVSDQVIGQINDVKTHLQAIDPNSLSETERVALRAALATLASLDLEEQVIGKLKDGFHTAESRLKALLEVIATDLDYVIGQLNAFSPQQLLSPLAELLKQADQLSAQIHGAALLQPLSKSVEQFSQKLAAVSPGTLLDPLQEPYRDLMSTIAQFNPDQWAGPVRAIYAQIQRVLASLDVTPLFAALDQQQKVLYDKVKQALLTTIDNLKLPEPLGTFFASIRQLLANLSSDDFFTDPDLALYDATLAAINQFTLISLFDPLDQTFDQLIALLNMVPQDTLINTINAVRSTLALALRNLDPVVIIDRFRQGQIWLLALDPITLFGGSLALPQLKRAFEVNTRSAPLDRQGDVISVSARFDAVFRLADLTSPISLVQPLIVQHKQVVNALADRINTLDTSCAWPAYDRLRRNLERLAPDFLRQTQPLKYAEIMDAMEAMRPSRKAGQIEHLVEQVLQKIRPWQDNMTSAMKSFFYSIRKVLLLLNPVPLQDVLQDIANEIQDKIKGVDPETLIMALHRNVYDPLVEDLEALNPAGLKQDLSQAYEQATKAITEQVKGFVNDMAGMFEEQLDTLRTTIQTLLSSLKNKIQIITETLQRLQGEVEQFMIKQVLARLNQVLDRLDTNFDAELDRVRRAFDSMLVAMPIQPTAHPSVLIPVV